MKLLRKRTKSNCIQ